MQTLFRLAEETGVSGIELRQWDYARTGLVQSIEKIEHYHQDYPIAVASSHLLVRLIQTVNISRNLTFDRYIANCSARSLNVAQALKLTSSLSKGQMWDGVFYGNGTKEIIIGHDSLFSIQEAHDNWKAMQPVTVLMHNQTNTALLLPDGRISSLDKGVAVIAVNIPMLMAMYYRFNQEQDMVEMGGGARRTISQFVDSYALAGMVRSHLDNVVLNRLYSRATGTPTTTAIRKHSFFTTNYDSALDTAADQQLQYLRTMKNRFSGVMQATHLPIAGNLWNFSKLPSVPMTLQAFWALVVARVKIVAFLCVAQRDCERINARELETIRWLTKIHQTRQVIKNNMGIEAYYDIAPYLDIIGIE